MQLEVVVKEPLTNGGSSISPNKFDNKKETEDEETEPRQSEPVSETNAVNEDDKKQNESKTERVIMSYLGINLMSPRFRIFS